jgi:hypothetical protein
MRYVTSPTSERAVIVSDDEGVSAGAIFLLSAVGGAIAFVTARLLDGVLLAGRTVRYPE